MARPDKKVILTNEEKAALTAIVKKGTHKSRKITRARVLLALDLGKNRANIQTEFDICSAQYYLIKRRYFEGGLSTALEELPRSGQPRKVTAVVEAHITSLACSAAPEGSSRWTLSLINEHLVALHQGKLICNESIRQVLKKVNLSRG